ncbi:MAG: valine--tRNA ligase [Gemmatimonadota bacterium]
MTSTRPRTAPEMSAHYDHATNDAALYAEWEQSGAFRAHAERVDRSVSGGRRPFVIVIPPPNVTAILHMGHGLNNTVQDVLIRWRRMAGDETLWVPGTDHAGIATQNVVEKQLASEGKTRFEVGRDAFVARTAAFVEETGGTILQQLRAIGASLDWSRTAYTLSPQLSRAVREAFVRLYDKGLIYRGHRVIHWCPRCLTSLSDEEAESHESDGRLFHIRYLLTPTRAGEESRHITVATTRPETLLGDVAVAVNPADERYRDLIGRTVRLPLTALEIPIIGDDYADPAFGSGAVKITPAHDANDFDVGQRHGLAMPIVIGPDGEMLADDGPEARVPPDLAGLDRFEARKRIVARLEADGLLDKVEQHRHALRRCYRCDTIVEPRLSEQWFVRMRPLAAPALEAVRQRQIRILPERWEAVYVNWLEGIRDWNISRQLWWGHRVPVWYCDGCGKVSASQQDLARCPSCAGPVHQDEDVLDTWFSSALWPFSTLGWPDESPDLRAFYPNDVLVTAPEILFFWVARMIMTGYAFMGEAPFHTVYLHGTVRDTRGQKMSKSLNNGIDPLDVVGRYGADALRYTVVAGMGLGADSTLDPDDLERSFAPGRNFVTKLWNIGRFLLGNVGSDPVRPVSELDPSELTAVDRWILGRLDAAIAGCDAALGPPRPDSDKWSEAVLGSGLRLNEYAESARALVWNDLADWYVEAVKPRLARAGEDREVARAILVHVFDQSLRLLHPIVPFVTETQWRLLPVAGRQDDEQLVTAQWPRASARIPGQLDFAVVKEAVIAIRQLRADYSIAPGKVIAGFAVPANGDGAILEAELETIARLGKCALTVTSVAPPGAAAHQVLTGGTELVLPLAGMIDVDRERARLRSEIEQLDRQLEGIRARLGNESFVARARPDVVEGERRREAEWTARRQQLAGKVASLCG